MYHKEIASKIINILIKDIGIVKLTEEEKKKKGTTSSKEIGFVNYKELASGLKETTFTCITNNDEVYAYENNGKKMMKWLYEFYQSHSEYLPPEYRAIIMQYDGEYQSESKKEDLKTHCKID